MKKEFLIVVLLLQACNSATQTAYIPSKRASRKYSAPTQQPYTINGNTYYPLPSEKGFVQEGIASWYGDDFHGKLTACGELYDMYAETAAHKTLPMHTYVRVTNLRNDRQIVVRINDRGPFVQGRIIDLSHAGAEKIGILNSGTAPVRVEALGRKIVSADKKVTYVPLNYTQGDFTIQVGAFLEKANAERLVKNLTDNDYENAHWVTYDSPRGLFYRVRVGKYNSLEQARAARQKIEDKGASGAFIVAE